MKKTVLFLLIIFSCFEINAQSNDLWQKSTLSSALNKRINDTSSGKVYYKLNIDLLKKKLSTATAKTTGSKSYNITIPNLNGTFEKFTVSEHSNLEPELQAKYPDIKSYQGYGVDDKSAKIHFSLAPIGLQVMVLRDDKPTEFIEENPANKEEYILFNSENSDNHGNFSCETVDLAADITSKTKTAKPSSTSGVFKKFRLALSCTGEYAKYYGGTKAGALAGMNATLTRVNGVLNKDLSVELVLIGKTDAVIYTNAATDPYSDSSRKILPIWINEVQKTLTAEIGEANYDIGHLFGTAGGGGLAALGAVCHSPTASGPLGKGSACTSTGLGGIPKGDYFDCIVMHEIGHQLGAEHAYSYAIDGSSTYFEPGSGSSIMGYAGAAGKYNVQTRPDAYFSYASIMQIQNTLAHKTCSQDIRLTNKPPTVDAGADYTIPLNTPFVLKGKGSSSDGNTITYNWEQNDAAKTTDMDKSFTYPAKPDGPLFRSVKPSTSPVRYMPNLQSVIQNRLTTHWESVSSISRTLNFSLTARNNAALRMGQINSDEMKVIVNARTGPFMVTSQNADNVNWDRSSTQKVTWDVNGTDKLEGSSTVNIKLSIDGGLTFPFLLASNTPNDGVEDVVAPAKVKASINCRILVEPTANIYYAINSKPFSIGYGGAASCNSYSFGPDFAVPPSLSFTERTVIVPPLNDKLLNVSVALDVTHKRTSDLEIELVSPRGTTVKLFDRNCNSDTGKLQLLFDDAGIDLDCSNTERQIVLPITNLKAFLGEDPQGVWTIRILDKFVNYTGRINAASLEICTGDLSLGTTNPELNDNAFAVFPNPNKGNFTVEFQSQSLLGVKIYVHDIYGKNVYADTFDNSSDFSQKIHLPGIAAGVYLVTIIDGTKKMVKKIVVQ